MSKIVLQIIDVKKSDVTQLKSKYVNVLFWIDIYYIDELYWHIIRLLLEQFAKTNWLFDCKTYIYQYSSILESCELYELIELNLSFINLRICAEIFMWYKVRIRPDNVNKLHHSSSSNFLSTWSSFFCRDTEISARVIFLALLWKICCHRRLLPLLILSTMSSSVSHLCFLYHYRNTCQLTPTWSCQELLLSWWVSFQIYFLVKWIFLLKIIWS